MVKSSPGVSPKPRVGSNLDSTARVRPSQLSLPIVGLGLTRISKYLSIYLSIYLSVYLSICLSIYIYLYLYLYLSMYIYRKREREDRVKP